MFETQLFVGDNIRFTAYDPDKDASIEAAWTSDIEYMRAIRERPSYPLSEPRIKKMHEERCKYIDKHELFFWALRLKEDERLIGWVKLWRIEWTHHTCFVTVVIGAPTDRRHGYGNEAMRLALRYGFDELNLHRISAINIDTKSSAASFLQRFGFVEEVRRREAILIGNQRVDEVYYGLLRSEWQRGEQHE
jgi:RimJ/RimL family protein N-acetyltransferase